MVIGAALQTAAHERGLFMAARGIIGLGITPAIVGASNLIGELAHPKERARLGSLFNAAFFTYAHFSHYWTFADVNRRGSTLAAAFTIASFRMNSEWAWRIPSLLQALPASISMTFVSFIPESPR